MAKIFDVSELNLTLRGLRIPHGNFKTAFERGKELFQLRDYGMPGSGILLSGPTGVGKTTLADSLVDYGRKHFGENSVLLTQLSGTITMKGVLANLLQGFGDPNTSRGDANIFAKRLSATIKARDCRVIIVDETQHLIPGGSASPRVRDTILNSFKTLAASEVSFVLAGIESIDFLWSGDEQLRSRFQTTYYLDVLRYPADRPAWRGIIKKYLDTMADFGVTVECTELEDRLYAACQGAMRPLMLILCSAIVKAYKDGECTITVEHLRKAAHEQIDKRDGAPNAFDLDMEQITRFNREGVAKRKLAPMKRGLGDILSA